MKWEGRTLILLRTKKGGKCVDASLMRGRFNFSKALTYLSLYPRIILQYETLAASIAKLGINSIYKLKHCINGDELQKVRARCEYPCNRRDWPLLLTHNFLTAFDNAR